MPSTPVCETSEPDRELLLETIVYDLLWSVFHVGTFATVLNGCTRTDADSTLRPWRHLLSDNNKIMQLALRYATEIGLTEQDTAKMAKLYNDIAAEKLRLAPLVECSMGRTGADRQQLVAAATSWRRLAKEAKSILLAFADLVVRRLGDLLAEDARTLLQFLDEAAAGSDRRVGPSGEISLPVLKQMRHQPRMKIEGRCTVLVADKSVAAALKDVSVRGLGIICDRALPEKESITLVLEDGRQLKGKVASRRGDLVGLLFDSRLSYNDPLFRRTTGHASHARARTAV